MTIQQTEEDIINYINNRLIITGNDDDYILSCRIKIDLDVSYQAIARILLRNKSIKKRITNGSMNYIGVKYK